MNIQVFFAFILLILGLYGQCTNGEAAFDCPVGQTSCLKKKLSGSTTAASKNNAICCPTDPQTCTGCNTANGYACQTTPLGTNPCTYLANPLCCATTCHGISGTATTIGCHKANYYCTKSAGKDGCPKSYNCVQSLLADNDVYDKPGSQ